MEAHLPISIKRLSARKLKEVQAGHLSRDEAEKLLKEKLRHSSKLRADLIASLTKNYDREAVKTLEYFRLI